MSFSGAIDKIQANFRRYTAPSPRRSGVSWNNTTSINAVVQQPPPKKSSNLNRTSINVAPAVVQQPSPKQSSNHNLTSINVAPAVVQQPSLKQSRNINSTSINVAPAVVQQTSPEQSSNYNSTSTNAHVSILCPHCKRPLSALAAPSIDQLVQHQQYVNRGVVPDQNDQQMSFNRQQLLINMINSAQRDNSTNHPQVAANLQQQYAAPQYHNMDFGNTNNDNTHSNTVIPQVEFGYGRLYPHLPDLNLKGRGVDHQYSNSTKLPQVAVNLQQYAAPQYQNMDLGNNNTRSVTSQVEFENGRVYPDLTPILEDGEAISNQPSIQGIPIWEKKANFKDVLMKDLPPDQDKTEEEEEEEKEDKKEDKSDDGPWETVESNKGKTKTAQAISNSQRRGNGRDKYKSKHQKSKLHGELKLV